MLLSLWSVCRRCENENCPSSGMSVATIVLGFTSSWTQAIIDTLVNFCMELLYQSKTIFEAIKLTNYSIYLPL
jgi:hypothetical protein